MPLLERAHTLEEPWESGRISGQGRSDYASWETSGPGIFQGICGFPGGGAGQRGGDPDH